MFLSHSSSEQRFCLSLTIRRRASSICERDSCKITMTQLRRFGLSTTEAGVFLATAARMSSDADDSPLHLSRRRL